MPARVFVAAALRPGEVRQPERRIVLESFGHNRIQNRWRRTNIGNNDFAAEQPAGQQEVTGLLAKKSDGENHRDGAQDFTRIAHHTARNVDCDDRRSLLGRGGQSFLGGALQRAAAPGAEDCVHHQFRPFERGWRQRFDRATPALRMMVCFALQTFARSE